MYKKIGINLGCLLKSGFTNYMVYLLATVFVSYSSEISGFSAFGESYS